MSEKTKRKQNPELRAQTRILRVLEEFPRPRQLAILDFMLGQIIAAEKYELPTKLTQANIGQMHRQGLDVSFAPEGI